MATQTDHRVLSRIQTDIAFKQIILLFVVLFSVWFISPISSASALLHFGRTAWSHTYWFQMFAFLEANLNNDVVQGYSPTSVN